MRNTTCCSGDCNQGRLCPSRSNLGGGLPLICLLLAVFIVLLAYVGPSLDDHSGEFGAADDAIAQHKREERLASIIKRVCGDGAAGQLDGTTLQCFTHKGRKTITAQVAP